MGTRGKSQAGALDTAASALLGDSAAPPVDMESGGATDPATTRAAT
jgi:hypothetical protein